MKFKLVEAAESKICCICKKPFEGYGNNAEPICSGSCCDECNMKEVIPARMKMLDNSSAEDIDEAVLTETNESGEDEIDANCEKCGAIIKVPADFFDEVDDEGNLVDKKVICASCREKNKSLNEGNAVSGKIPPALDSFLQDIAQMYQTIDYGDIMDHDYTEDDIRKLNNLRRRFITWSQYDEDDEEVKAKFDEIANKVAEILKRVDESMNEGRNNPYFTPYGYRAAAKVLNRTAPEYYWHLKEIEMDKGDGIKLANYALKKGLPVMLDKNSDPDYPEFYLKDGSSEYHWGDYFYTYGFINPDAADLVPYEGNLDILNAEKDDNKMNEDMSVRAKLKALYPELNFGDKVVEEDFENAFDAEDLDEEISEVEGQMSFFDDDMNFDIEEDDGIRRMNTLYNGADFDAHDDEALEESSDCEDDECWENDIISDDYDDGM